MSLISLNNRVFQAESSRRKPKLLTAKRNAVALCRDPVATLDDLREAVTTFTEIERTARRVLGGAHPVVMAIGRSLRDARAALAAHNTPPPPLGAA